MGSNNYEKRQEKEYVRMNNKEYRDTLSPQEQLKRLDERLGVGKGAKKERLRLNKQILMCNS